MNTENSVLSKSFDGIMHRISRKLSTASTGNGSTLANRTFGAKSLFNVEGYVTGCGQPDWERTHDVAQSTAPVIERLIAEGAELTCITCSDELACSLDGINDHYGIPLNPQFPDRIPGGSSSGSASVVATNLVDFALGTDTAGSVRVPASYCGIYGLRPTHDSIAIDGVFPLGPSFDTVGIFTRTLDLLNDVLGVISETQKSNSESSRLPGNLLLIDPEKFALAEPIKKTYEHCCNALRGQFSNVKFIDLQEVAAACANDFTILRAGEAWGLHGEWFTRTKPNMAPAIYERFSQCGTFSASQIETARKELQELRARIAELLGEDFLLVTPTTADLPPLRISTEEFLLNNRKKNVTLNTVSSCCGYPQLVIPVPIRVELETYPSGTTTGLSLLSARGSDFDLLATAQKLSSLL